MIRNRYNRIPHPALTPNGKGTPTITTILKNKNSTSEKPRGQLFPNRWPQGKFRLFPFYLNTLVRKRRRNKISNQINAFMAGINFRVQWLKSGGLNRRVGYEPPCKNQDNLLSLPSQSDHNAK